MKTATSLTFVAVGAIVAFAITAHPGFLNLQVTGWVLILTGIGGAIITHSSRLRRTPAASNLPGTATASSTSQRTPPTPPPAPRRQPAATPDTTSAEHQTIKEYADA